MPLLQGLIILLNSEYYIPEEVTADYDPWKRFYTNIITPAALFLLPLFVSLLVTFNFYMEERGRGWKHLLVQPVSRLSLLLTKVAFLLSYLAVAHVLFLVYSLLAGLVIGMVHPDMLFFDYPVPFFELLSLMAWLFVSALGIFGIHLLVSLRFSGYIVSVAIALAGTVLTLMTVSWVKGYIIPYSAPFTELAVWNKARELPAWLGVDAHIFLSLSIFCFSLVMAAITFHKKGF